jgi:transcriptional regulator with XRE-family HTH domain
MKDGFEGLVAIRLRELRNQRGFTLDEFERFTEGAVKAVVMGSYERGTRSISIARLGQLASYFGVSLQYFLAPPKSEITPSPERWIFDLRVMRAIDSKSDQMESLKSFLQEIASQRSDWDGEVLSIRESDKKILELFLSQVGFLEKLIEKRALIN